MNTPAPDRPAVSPAPRRLLTPTVVFLVLILAGYCAFALSVGFRQRLGFSQSQFWFLDSYAVLAGSDAAGAGSDPFLSNPLDVLGRPHAYSSWWFFISRCGLTRENNFQVGLVLVAAFLVAASALLRPRSYRAAIWCTLLMLSPPVLLAVFRANNDLVIFVLLAAGILMMPPVTPWRLILFASVLSLATGLKFYPVVAGIALLVVRPWRLMVGASALALLAAGGALALVLGDMHRAWIIAPDGLYTVGAPLVFHNLAWSPPAVLGAGAALLIAAAAVCWWKGWFLRLDDASVPWRERLAFACGAALLVGCFLAGVSFAYRLVFVIFIAPLIGRAASKSGRIWRLVAVLAVLWLDGLYCLVANLEVSPLWLKETLRPLWFWRLVSQPVIWAAMVFLASCLLEMIHSAWSDWRKSMRPAS